MDETTSEMKDNINGIDRKLQRLDEASNQTKMLKNQANFIANKLELFDQSYLKSPGNHGDYESNWILIACYTSIWWNNVSKNESSQLSLALSCHIRTQ